MREPRIRKLDETVANQIAAGEVVERPASVVKELVENALDAGATRVEVEIEGGGAKRITVSDNGCGMSAPDVVNALERQATSKIATTEDIVRIATFGFRGEAVPSIASVSRFVMTSRTAEEDAATRINVNGGLTEAPVVTGHPIGTTVEVRDLFFNLPARRKFLRAPATEQTRIRQALTAIALAHPEVAFRLRADGRELFRLPAEDTLDDRIRALLGDAIADAMVEVEGTFRDIHLYGRLTRPDFIRAGTPETFLFINRRPATAPQIQYALRETFPKDKRPTVVLFLDLPPEEVDVNVHPAKREVRFRHGNIVTAALVSILTAALNPPAPTLPMPAAHSPVDTPLPRCLPTGTLPTPQAPRFISATTPPRTSVPPPPANAPDTLVDRLYPAADEPLPPLPYAPPKLASSTLHPTSPVPNAPWRWFNLLGLLEHGYWLLVTEQGYVTVDAKAALERVTYERLKAQTAVTASQPLLIPETFTLSAADADRVRRYLDELQACGFGLAALAGDTFMIDALPTVLDNQNPITLVANLAAELDASGVKRGEEAWQREVVARAAAKAVCRVTPVITHEGAEALLRQLAQCEMAYATPRGTPTMFLTDYRELARRFRRV